MTIIGICGFSGSGKDTVASYLVENYGYKKLSFASVLKDVVSIIFSWDRNMLEGIDQESRIWREQEDIWWSNKLGIKVTPRFILQYIGTELFRNNFHENIWSLILERKLTEYEKVVITDCRFENEISMLRNNGALIFHVSRNTPRWFEDFRKGKYTKEVENLHESEKCWIREEFDYEIANNSTIQQLHINIDEIFN